MKLKKILPFIFVFAALSSYLIIQVYFDASRIEAKSSEDKEKLTEKYQKIFQELELQTVGSDSKTKLVSIRQKVVILNFWASWCRPCLSEFESLNLLIEKYGERIKVIGINNDEDDSVLQIKKMQKKYQLKFESVSDPYGKYASLFDVSTIPYSIIFANGKVIKISTSEINFVDPALLKLIDRNL